VALEAGFFTKNYSRSVTFLCFIANFMIFVQIYERVCIIQLTPHSRDLGNPVGPQVVEKFPTFYGTCRSILPCSEVCHLF